MTLLLVVYRRTATHRLLAIIIEVEIFDSHSIPTGYGEIIFIASTRCSGKIESDVRTLITMLKSELKRPGKKTDIKWVTNRSFKLLET